MRGDRLQAEGFYTSLVNSLDNDTPLFVLSFCRHTEEKTIKHGLLSQWRGYAGSAGFAIEFDVDELDKLMKVECDTFAYPVMKSDYVIKLRSKEGLIVPYIELFKGISPDLPITSIIVGPHPFQDKQEAAVRMALKSTPFSKAPVRLSAIPFRRRTDFRRAGQN